MAGASGYLGNQTITESEGLIVSGYSFVNRENRVPHYQRLFFEGQKHHVRQWVQVHIATYAWFAEPGV
ncbi:hypothetical protein DH86_00000233 [Scytalidium sp. 3C]|nr:hypothetical protein DH86_00000233 [Scytalidium sp. 3C]